MAESVAGRRALAWLIGLAVALALIYLLCAVLLPFVAGAAIAYLLDPLADRLERAGVGRTLAVTLITGVFLLGFVAALLLLVPVLQGQLVGFIERAPSYVAALQTMLEGMLETMRARIPADQLARLHAAAEGYVGDAAQWLTSLLGSVFSGAGALLSLLSLLFITPIVAFYLLRDWDRIVGTIDDWLPRRQQETIRGLIAEIDTRLAGFLCGQMLVAAILGVAYATGLTLVGLEFGLVIGLGAGIASLVPFVGAALGFVVSVGVALAQFDSLTPVGIVAAIFLVGQVAEGNFLTPKLVGDRVGLHPVWIIFAMLAGGSLLGFVGVLLAVPAAAAFGVLARFGVERYKASTLYLGPGGDA